VDRDDQPDAREGQAGRPGEAERFVVPLKPGNAGDTVRRPRLVSNVPHAARRHWTTSLARVSKASLFSRSSKTHGG
jgi:hypothetical protein